MEITSLTISADRTTLDLVISDAASVSALRLWKTTTFKDYTLAKDLTASLTGSATENLSFTPSDLDEAYFDGVYFVEATQVGTASLAITADYTRWKECIITELIETTVCENCLEEESISLLNAHILLRGLEDAINIGFIDEIFNIVDALNTYCSDACKTCGDYGNIITDAYYEINT